jgi:hypothetical protein
MMPDNTWRPSDASIGFFESALTGHRKVVHFDKRSEHVYALRLSGRSKKLLVVLVVDLYTVGQADVIQAMEDVPDLDAIVTVSAYNGYTPAAKKYAHQNGVALYQISEFLGALWRKEFLNYVKYDN